MTTFVAVHGAWSAGWAWHRFHPLMAKWGHRLLTPTCTGLGERAHLIGPWVGLGTHVEDVCRVLEFEDLRDIVLVGHSYGGMVVTGVVDRMPERIRHVVYLDALLPESGEAALDVLPAEHGRAIDKLIETQGHGWLIPPPPLPPDTPAWDVELARTRRLPQPARTFREPLLLRQPHCEVPRTYIYCRQANEFDSFARSAKRAQKDPSFAYLEMDASHNPHITQPLELARLLDDIAEARSVPEKA